MAGFLSPTHILLLLLAALILFGAKRLPELGRSLGSGLREFKHSLDADGLTQADSPTEPGALPATSAAPPD